MEHLGASVLDSPYSPKPFLASNDSPRLMPFPLTFGSVNIDKQYIRGEFSEANKSDDIDEDDRMVEERKRWGFTGKEFTVEEAMSKQFGPDRVEARAFLEYYWETKAKCLEAVAKGRDSEVRRLQRHPLFSPNWINPWASDFKRYLHNGLQNRNENEKHNEDKKVQMGSNIPLQNRDSGLKRQVASPNRNISDTRRHTNYRSEENNNGSERCNGNRKGRIRSKIPKRIRDSGLKRQVASPNRNISDTRKHTNNRLEEKNNGSERCNGNRKGRIRSKIPERIR